MHRPKRTYSQDPVLKKELHYWKKYGITLVEVEQMIERQNGRCLICKESKQKLVVDHNHNTHRVRGLLCSGCNTAIGLIKENIESLKEAIAYLEKDVNRNAGECAVLDKVSKDRQAWDTAAGLDGPKGPKEDGVGGTEQKPDSSDATKP